MNLLRFSDLKARRIVNNRTSLQRLIRQHGFPPGFLLSPNSRAWIEDEVNRWIETRASESRPADIPSKMA